MQSYEDLKQELDKAYNNLDENTFEKIIESIKNDFKNRKNYQSKPRFKKENKNILKDLFSRLRIIKEIKKLKTYNRHQLKILKDNFIIQDDNNYEKEKSTFFTPINKDNYNQKIKKSDNTLKHVKPNNFSLAKEVTTKVIESSKEMIGLGIYLVEDKTSLLNKKIEEKNAYERKHAKEDDIPIILKDIGYELKYKQDNVVKKVTKEKLLKVKEKLKSIKNKFNTNGKKVVETSKETIGLGIYLVEDKSTMLGKNIKRKFESTKRVIKKGSKYISEKVKDTNEKRKQIIDELKQHKSNLLFATDNEYQLKHSFHK